MKQARPLRHPGRDQVASEATVKGGTPDQVRGDAGKEDKV